MPTALLRSLFFSSSVIKPFRYSWRDVVNELGVESIICFAGHIDNTMSSTPPEMLKTVILVGGPSKGCYVLLLINMASFACWGVARRNRMLLRLCGVFVGVQMNR
jgi:hypothetical protein